MKLKNPICTRIYTSNTLRNPEDFFDRLRFRCKHYPELIPEKCGFWEPLKIKFSPEIIDTLIPDDTKGQTDSLYWSRNKKIKSEGVVSVPVHGDTHSEEVIYSELAQSDQSQLIDYVKKVCHRFDADLAIIDMEVEDTWRVMNPHIGGIHPTTEQLKHWLPDMYWGVVFGKPYVDLFGSKLLAVPAYKVEKITDNLIFIQLTADINDLLNNPEQVRIEREKAKAFLNNEVFYSPEKGYKANETLWFFSGIQDGEGVRVPRINYYPQVFNTPNFILEKNDENIYSETNIPRFIETDVWEVSLNKEWLVQPIPPDTPFTSTGTVEEIRFFYKPDGYDAPIEKELFIGAWDRPERETMSRQKYAESILQVLASNYPLAQSEWSNVESKVDHFEEYSVVYLDQIDQQEFNLFRIAIKVIVFERFFVKVTFMDYWCNDLSESQEISNPIFNSFKAK
ncbi:hypothetical protein [Acinetobacter baumannii]|uniref:hypothetical protein n=1 Tax=Acinetobacter baumannii TaxID=470 RepID=UPI000A3620DB|nr:hypothetical protein [Acinetobacter baumannii]OTT97165.1 hypothetical protein CAT68_12890 [Acinetobacter baumannii]